MPIENLTPEEQAAYEAEQLRLQEIDDELYALRPNFDNEPKLYKTVGNVRSEITNEEALEYWKMQPTDQQLTDAAIANKLKELDVYHNSTEVRTLTINSTYEIYLTGSYRNLVAEQIAEIKLKIEEGDILEQDAVFNYYYNGDDSYIPVTYLQLKRIYITMMDIVNSNFVNYKNQRHQIKALTSVSDVENHDFSEGYLLNQNLNLT